MRTCIPGAKLTDLNERPGTAGLATGTLRIDVAEFGNCAAGDFTEREFQAEKEQESRMIGPLSLGMAGAACVLVGLYASKAQGKMVSRRAGGRNASAARNAARVVWMAVGVAFLAVAVIGAVGEISRS